MAGCTSGGHICQLRRDAAAAAVRPEAVMRDPNMDAETKDRIFFSLLRGSVGQPQSKGDPGHRPDTGLSVCLLGGR
jgi:hypothetical protein